MLNEVVLKDLFSTIDGLEQSTAINNWDDEWGQTIDSSQWQNARLVLARVDRTNRILVGACGDGYVHLTWVKTNGDRGILEIGPKQWWWSILRINENDESRCEIKNIDDALMRIVSFCDN